MVFFIDSISYAYMGIVNIVPRDPCVICTYNGLLLIAISNYRVTDGIKMELYAFLGLG